MPKASNSDFSHPAAVPRITRPLLKRSIEANDLATTIGFLIGRTRTVVPSFTFVVLAATQAITARGS